MNSDYSIGSTVYAANWINPLCSVEEIQTNLDFEVDKDAKGIILYRWDDDYYFVMFPGFACVVVHAHNLRQVPPAVEAPARYPWRVSEDLNTINRLLKME